MSHGAGAQPWVSIETRKQNSEMLEGSDWDKHKNQKKQSKKKYNNL